MTVYIEYAFLENFLFDGALLALSFYAAKTKISWLKLLFSAVCGGVFAVLYPLLSLPKILAYLLKILVGFLLCLLTFGEIKTKNEWGRYAFTVIFFFGFTFLFGGALTALLQEFFPEKTSFAAVAAGFAILSVFALVFLQKVYQKREVYAYIYDCEISFGAKKLCVRGFWDSGNRAEKKGLPVCFLSPLCVYELFGAALLDGENVEKEEMRIQTLGGEKKYPLYKGEVAIQKDGKFSARQAVYFAPATNMISREYELLLQSSIL